MTLTFKDVRGFERALLVGSVVTRGDGSQAWAKAVVPATLDDLTRAGFVQLSTGSDGPTDEELWRIDQAALAAVPDEASVRETNTAALRALFTAGSASRQPEVDRLMAEVARVKLEGLRQGSALADELAATKEKLASVSYRNKQLRRIARSFAADRSRAYAEAGATKEKLAEAEERLAEYEPEPPADSDPIAWLLRHESADVRAAVAEGIWQAEAVQYLPALREAAERETVPSAKEYMLHAAELLASRSRAGP